MASALQENFVEKARAFYSRLERPLLAQLCMLHGLTVREFADIFEISKSFAEEILNHKKVPSLELAFKISRYWQIDVVDLFGWRFDDDGQRRPLLMAVPGTREVVRLSSTNAKHKALAMVFAEYHRKQRERKRQQEAETSGQ